MSRRQAIIFASIAFASRSMTSPRSWALAGNAEPIPTNNKKQNALTDRMTLHTALLPGSAPHLLSFWHGHKHQSERMPEHGEVISQRNDDCRAATHARSQGQL